MSAERLDAPRLDKSGPLINLRSQYNPVWERSTKLRMDYPVNQSTALDGMFDMKQFLVRLRHVCPDIQYRDATFTRAFFFLISEQVRAIMGERYQCLFFFVAKV